MCKKQIIKYLPMKKIFVFSILFTALFTCCVRNRQTTNIETVNINPYDSSSMGFDDYFELDRYIRLESSNNALMQDIRKIVIVDDKIFILTWGKTKVLIFDMNGYLVNTIDKYGRGPGEYTYVVDFFIEDNGTKICLLDKAMKQLLYYDLNGNYLYSLNLGLDLETFTILEDGTILGYSFLNYNEPKNDTIYQLWHIDSNGSVIEGFFPVKPEYLGNSIGLSSTFNITSSDLFFIPYTENIIYRVIEDPIQIAPYLKINLMDRAIPSSLLDLPYKEMNESFDYAYILSGEYVGKRILLLNMYCFSEKRSITALYNLITGSYSLLDNNDIWDKTNELPIITDQQNQYDDADYIIALTYPFKILEHDFENKNSIGSKLKEVVNETDNPILLVYKERI